MAATVLGRDTETDRPVLLAEEARTRGVYIIGKNGTGKSTLILNMIVADMQQGRGVCLLDPHGDLTDDVLERVPVPRRADVLLLDAGSASHPFGINLFSATGLTDDAQRSRRVSEIVMAFRKAFAQYDFGITIATMLRNIAYVFVRHEGMRLSDIPAFLTDKAMRAQLLAPITNPLIRAYWRDYDTLAERDRVERVTPLMSRLSEILTNDQLTRILDQEETSLDFRQAMDTGKILLVKLPLHRLDADSVSLLGAMIVGQLLTAALSRGQLERDARTMFCLYADEFHRFATEDFGTFFNEARKYSIALTIAHQERGQIIDPALRTVVLGAETLIVFGVSGEDAASLAREFDHTPPPGEPVLKMITEPVYATHSETKWDTRENAVRNTMLLQEIEEAKAALKDIEECCPFYEWRTPKLTLNTRSGYFGGAEAYLEGFQHQCFFGPAALGGSGSSRFYTPPFAVFRAQLLPLPKRWRRPQTYVLNYIEADLESRTYETRFVLPSDTRLVIDHWIEENWGTKPWAADIVAAAKKKVKKRRKEIAIIYRKQLGSGDSDEFYTPDGKEWWWGWDLTSDGPRKWVNYGEWEYYFDTTVWRCESGWEESREIGAWLAEQFRPIFVERERRLETLVVQQQRHESAHYVTETWEEYRYDQPVRTMERDAFGALREAGQTYHWEEGPRRSYADMENEITTRLANLPRFTAQVKTVQGEFTVKTQRPLSIVGSFTPEIPWRVQVPATVEQPKYFDAPEQVEEGIPDSVPERETQSTTELTVMGMTRRRRKLKGTE